MPAATRKRLRGEPAETLSPSKTRFDLLSRALGTPPFWCGDALSAGVESPDGFLVHLGRAISAALHVVNESAEAARIHLRETRAALHVAVDARCDELDVSIDLSQANKVASLERELVAVDAALESWKVESRAVREAASSLSDADLEIQRVSLSSRLDDMEAQLQELPTAVVEPPFVGLLTDAPALLSSITGFGHVLAPLPITAADLCIDGVPRSISPGDPLRLRLSLGARHAAQSAEDLEVSLGRLVGATYVEATLEGPSITSQLLMATLGSDASHHILHACIAIPSPVTDGASVEIRVVSVAGQPVRGFPVRFQFRRGITPSLLLKVTSSTNHSTPCISPDGRIYCPPNLGPEVLVFDNDGAPLPGIPVVSLGLSQKTSWAAYADRSIPSLILADFNGGSSRLVAVDPATRAVRWASASGCFNACRGVTAIPSLGVVLVSCEDTIVAHRLADGIRVGSLGLAGLRLYRFMAGDNASGAMYGSSVAFGVATVQAWSCSTDVADCQITVRGPVRAAGARPNHRPLALMPSASGKTVSHLVVGVCESPELLVLSLPGLALVHTHTLEGMQVTGLAADPWGEALAVCDYTSQSLHVLGWPLPGMPQLQ